MSSVVSISVLSRKGLIVHSDKEFLLNRQGMRMKELDDILRRLDHLESHQSIRSLVTAYAIACDEHDIPRLKEMFTAGAVFCSPNGSMISTGREAICDMFTAILKTRGPGFHWTHDVHATIDPENPDHATGVVYSHAETTPNGVASLAAMKYQDRYIRDHGIWRFNRREISFFYYVPFTQYNERLNEANRVHINGVWHAADFPESLESWRQFAAGESV